MHLRAATASAALARLPLQISSSRKAKHYDKSDLEGVHVPAHVESSTIAGAPFIITASPVDQPEPRRLGSSVAPAADALNHV